MVESRLAVSAGRISGLSMSFTLVELIIVLVVVGILAVGALFLLAPAVQKPGLERAYLFYAMYNSMRCKTPR